MQAGLYAPAIASTPNGVRRSQEGASRGRQSLPPREFLRRRRWKGVYNYRGDCRGEHGDVGHEGHNGPGAVVAIDACGRRSRRRVRGRVGDGVVARWSDRRRVRGADVHARLCPWRRSDLRLRA
eukprot:5954818-Pleurochrysis_carterae.AAC.3